MDSRRRAGAPYSQPSECLPRVFALLGGGGVQGEAGVAIEEVDSLAAQTFSSSVAIGQRFSPARCAILA